MTRRGQEDLGRLGRGCGSRSSRSSGAGRCGCWRCCGGGGRGSVGIVTVGIEVVVVVSTSAGHGSNVSAARLVAEHGVVVGRLPVAVAARVDRRRASARCSC